MKWERRDSNKRFWYPNRGMAKKKNAAAVELGRRGGKKKVPKGLSMLDPEQRKKVAQAGAAARWGKKSK